MKKNILTSVLSLLLITSCNDNFLDKSPLDKLSEDKYFQTENDLNTYSLSFYPLQEGYAQRIMLLPDYIWSPTPIRTVI